MMGFNSTPESEQSDSKEEGIEIAQSPDDWLPITQSRKGNSWTAMFHLVCSGIGIQSLSIPLSFLYLGWFWGILCLSVAFIWQFYTIVLLVSLHESVDDTRYSRYLHLSMVAFGVKLGKVLAIFPLMYLSGGTCVMFIITGGGTMKLFYQLVCEECSTKNHLTTTHLFLVFTCLSILVSMFYPNLDSTAFVSFLGATMAIGYCSILCVVLVSRGRVEATLYNSSEPSSSEGGHIQRILNALGIITVAFRGHNLVLEIQGTMPSSPPQSSSKLMFKGVVASYLIIAMCFFPIAIGGYWAFGNMILTNGGLLISFSTSLHHKTSKTFLGVIYVQIIISCVTSFQIYSMVVYDNLERAYVSRKCRECPKLTRIGIRVFFGCLTFFISIAFPFLPSLALVFGGIALPLTFGYPCLMWIAIKKPPPMSAMWWTNLGLGCMGIGLSVFVIFGAVWDLDCRGLKVNLFHPY